MKHLLAALCAVLAFAAVSAAEPAQPKPADVAGRQIDLCMIGDSITWFGQGDYFRANVLKHLPNVAFVGTHSALLGYSHAGEGGDNVMWGFKKRVDDRDRIPDCRYYHLLMGVNDASGTKDDAAADGNAARIAKGLMERVDSLLARPGTEKVFLGTIFPCCPDSANADAKLVERYRLRDLTSSKINEILRREVPAKYGEKVVLIEYEKVLRARDDWKKIIRLHPNQEGYKVVGKILADSLRANAKPGDKKLARFGVEVTNLYVEGRKCTRPLIPGWYTVSFDVKSVKGDKIEISAVSRNARMYKTPLNKKFKVAAKPGQRVHFTFMTGYEGYGYNESPVILTAENGEIANIQVEKKRPSDKPSVYGKGTFVDSTSPMSLGEKFVPVR